MARMTPIQVDVDVDVEKLKQIAEAFQWFAGRLSAAADELHDTLDALTGEGDS